MDLTLPGYKYLGPFNKLDKGPPNNWNDLVALNHDIEYGHIELRGGNPYLYWSDADAEAIKQWVDDDYGGRWAKKFYNWKKRMYESGYITEWDAVSPPKLRGSTKRASEYESYREKKRLKSEIDPAINAGEEMVSSFENTPPSTQAMEGQGSGNDAGLKETKVDNVYNVTRGPPDYTFVTLPTVEMYDINVNPYYSHDHVYRMTSPYDVREEQAAYDFNTNTGTTLISQANETSIRSANYFNFYAGMYNYYHVVSAQYNVYVENMGGEPIWVYAMFFNDDRPKGEGSNVDHQLWKGVKYHFLDRRYLAITSEGNMELGEAEDTENREQSQPTADNAAYETSNHVSGGGRYNCFFSGEYRPGDFNREIRLDSQVENWTSVSTNPGLPEKLLIRIKPYNDAISEDSTSNYGDWLKYRLRVKINYLVEFKELKTALRYPIVKQPLTVSLTSGVI